MRTEGRLDRSRFAESQREHAETATSDKQSLILNFQGLLDLLDQHLSAGLIFKLDRRHHTNEIEKGDTSNEVREGTFLKRLDSRLPST